MILSTSSTAPSSGSARAAGGRPHQGAQPSCQYRLDVPAWILLGTNNTVAGWFRAPSAKTRVLLGPGRASQLK